jgi:hypothetical protein
MLKNYSIMIARDSVNIPRTTYRFIDIPIKDKLYTIDWAFFGQKQFRDELLMSPNSFSKEWYRKCPDIDLQIPNRMSIDEVLESSNKSGWQLPSVDMVFKSLQCVKACRKQNAERNPREKEMKWRFIDEFRRELFKAMDHDCGFMSSTVLHADGSIIHDWSYDTARSFGSRFGGIVWPIDWTNGQRREEIEYFNEVKGMDMPEKPDDLTKTALKAVLGTDDEKLIRSICGRDVYFYLDNTSFPEYETSEESLFGIPIKHFNLSIRYGSREYNDDELTIIPGSAHGVPDGFKNYLSNYSCRTRLTHK